MPECLTVPRAAPPHKSWGTKKEMKMGSYYLTYQPAAVVEEIMEGEYRVKTERYKEISREVGYNPIFLIPMENKVDFYIKNFIATAGKPEKMIIVELDHTDCIDAAKLFETKGNENRYECLCVSEETDVEKEYITDKIRKEDVRKVIDVRKITDMYPGLKSMFLQNGTLNKNLSMLS